MEKAYGDLRVVDGVGAARHGGDAVGEVDDLGVALGQFAALVSGVDLDRGVDLDGRGGGQSQKEGNGSEGLHVDGLFGMCERMWWW